MFGKKDKRNPLTITPPQQDEYEDEISNEFPQQQQYTQPYNLQQPPQFQQPQQQPQQFQQPQVQQPIKQKTAIIVEGSIKEDGYYYVVKTDYPLKLGYCKLENVN